MGRYIVVLAVPIIIGVLIAAGIIVMSALRQRRDTVRGPLFDAKGPDGREETADPSTRRRIAS